MLQQMKKNKRDSEKLLVITYLIVDLPFQIFFLDIRKGELIIIYSFVFRLVYKANKL